MDNWFRFYEQYPQTFDNILSMYFIETVDLLEARFVCQDSQVWNHYLDATFNNNATWRDPKSYSDIMTIKSSAVYGGFNRTDIRIEQMFGDAELKDKFDPYMFGPFYIGQLTY